MLNWTYSNAAESICKTIEYVIRILRNNGQVSNIGAPSQNDLQLLLFGRALEQKKMLSANNGTGLQDEKDRVPKSKADAAQIQPS